MRRKDEQAAVGADPEGAVLVGRLLRERRRSRGLTPEEAGVAIRVAVRHVLAIEDGRFADLPPQPYARGLISSYATLLGLEPEELLRVCGSALAGEGGGPAPRIFRYPLTEKFIWREWAVPFSLSAGVTALVVVRALLGPAPIHLEAPAPAVVAQPVRQLVEPADINPPPDQPSEVPVATPGVRVLLRCEGTTWAEASPDGAEMRRYELGPGQNLQIAARERLSLSLGDAGVIRLHVNERELGFIGFKGETKTGLMFTAGKPAPAAAVAPRGVVGD